MLNETFSMIFKHCAFVFLQKKYNDFPLNSEFQSDFFLQKRFDFLLFLKISVSSGNYCSTFLLHFRLLLLWNILKLDPLAATFRGASSERERKKAVGLELGDKFKRGVPGHQANITSIHVQGHSSATLASTLLWIKIQFQPQMVITGCPNKFGIRSEMFASKASIVYKKIVFCSKKKCFLSLFCELQEILMDF